MNDWIYHHIVLFWGSLILFGMAAGAMFLSEPYGLAGGLAAGALGGAGSAIILSASRYIGSSHTEE